MSEEIKKGKNYRLIFDQLHASDEETLENLKDSRYLGFSRGHELLGASGDVVNVTFIIGDLAAVCDGEKTYYTRASNLEPVDPIQITKESKEQINIIARLIFSEIDGMKIRDDEDFSTCPPDGYMIKYWSASEQIFNRFHKGDE